MIVEKKKRNTVRTLKLTAEEDRAIQRAAKHAGLTWSEYVRGVVLQHAAPELTTEERLRASGS